MFVVQLLMYCVRLIDCCSGCKAGPDVLSNMGGTSEKLLAITGLLTFAEMVCGCTENRHILYFWGDNDSFGN